MKNKLFMIALVLVGLCSGVGIYYLILEFHSSKQVIQINKSLSSRFFLSGDAQGLNAASKTGGECSLDYLAQEGKRIDRNGIASPEIKTQFYGWGLVDGRLSNELTLEIKPIDSTGKLQSLYAKMGAGGVERRDVASVTGRKDLLNAGFYAEGDFFGAYGTYDLYLLMRAKEVIYQCNLNYKITVK